MLIEAQTSSLEGSVVSAEAVTADLCNAALMSQYSALTSSYRLWLYLYAPGLPLCTGFIVLPRWPEM